MAHDDTSEPRRSAPCPICKEPSVPAYRPFCSRRCADVDLSRWLSGTYAIPGREDDDEDGDSSIPGAPGGMARAANDDHEDD
jgi:endogenous inhibitor of DNA gyrase (YacG/DUF329 family)